VKKTTEIRTARGLSTRKKGLRKSTFSYFGFNSKWFWVRSYNKKERI